ncbi:MAG TPA: tetratricopeptide repeat protein [Pyrinomonadaceae bacterium]|jgi:tetratricopeptide (TPR) repeat protein
MKARPVARKALLVAASLLVCLCTPLLPPARGATKRAEWTRVRTKNFLFVGDADERDLKHLATRLEQFRQLFSRLLSSDYFDSTVPTTIVVFRDDASYRPFKPLYQGEPGDAAGHFQSGADVDYVSFSIDQRRRGSPYFIMVHEYVHLLVKNNFRNAPLWFNEGLAEYYSTLQASDGGRKLTLGKAIPSRLQTLRTSDRLLPLETLLGIDHESPFYNERDKRTVFYAESWALVHYLLNGDAGRRRPQLTRYLELLAEGVGFREAFPKAFETDFAGLENELKAYLSLVRLPEQTIAFEERLESEVEAESRRLTEAEALAYLGDMLLRTNRTDEAEGYLQKSVALAPNLSMARTSLGIIRTKQNRLTEAVEHLSRAVASDPQSHLAHYYYANALSHERMDASLWVTDYEPQKAEQMRAALRRTIELAPRYVDAYHLLAFVNLVREEQLDESVELLKHALTLAPRRHEFSLLLAQIHLRRENFDAARAILDKLSQSTTPHLRGQAETLLKSLALRREIVARRRAENEPPTETVGLAPLQPCDMSYSGAQHKKLRFEGVQRCGKLARVECEEAGVLLFVEVEGGTLKLRSDALNRIRFVTYTTEVKTGQLTCGLREPANPVLVTYRPPTDSRADTDGEVIAVEFIPRDWYAGN